MDRQIVYPGSIPLDTDLLGIQRNIMVAMGYLAQATLGNTTIADGLACTPTSPASLSVVIGSGSITQFGVVDSEAFGSLPALADPLLRIGVNLNPTTFALTPPTVAGQSINYLVEASLLEVDATPVVLPYYNAANPGQPFSGPNNTGVAQATQRLQSVQLQIKAGVPQTTGQQGTPAVDAGWVALYVIGVPAGATAITQQNIFVFDLAPFIFWKLPQLTPGTHNLAVFEPTTQGGWQVPVGVSGIKVRVWGGGGAGGSGFGWAGGGGAGGGYSEGFYSVSPGEVFAVSVGNGGAGAGSSGGNSSFGNLALGTGGQAGANGASDGGGLGAANGGTGSGSGFSLTGGLGGSAFGASGNWLSGAGGGAFGGSGAQSVSGTQTTAIAGIAGAAPGAGGSGGIGSGLGGNGGPGLVLVEW
jgi:hypothetical protein